MDLSALQPYLADPLILQVAGGAFMLIGLLYTLYLVNVARRANRLRQATEEIVEEGYETDFGEAFRGPRGLVEPQGMLSYEGDTNVMGWVDAMDAFEGYESGHGRRVALYARALGTRFGLPESDLRALEAAGLLHDVGEINEDMYIQESRPLTVSERLQLEDHPVKGARIVDQLPEMGHAALWVRWHQEKWDGTGYPDRLREEQIPLPARILAIADAYDAMTHDRPHRGALSPTEAEAELRRHAGTAFDPRLVEPFLALVYGAGDAVPDSAAA